MNRPVGHAMPPEMDYEMDYETALAAAGLLLHKLDARQHMPRHERLAIATYLILDAIRAGRGDAAVPAGVSARAEGEDLA